MKLEQLIEYINYEIVQPGGRDPLNVEVTDVQLDSRKIQPGNLFVCIKGAVFDGHSFAPDVAKAGASVIVIQDPVDMGQISSEVTVLRVENSRYALAGLPASILDQTLRPGLHFRGLVRPSGQRTDHHRHHRDQGQDHHDLHGQVHSGTDRPQGGPDRDHRGPGRG